MFKQFRRVFTLIMVLAGAVMSTAACAEGLATVAVMQANNALTFTAEGLVEAVKSSVIAPQVSGSITAFMVKVGDHVKAGQLLARIDTRMATQQTVTNQAQVAAAQAQLFAARKEYERKHRLYEKQYISQAALERAESDFKTAEAQTKAQLAQTDMAGVQAGFYIIKAPYSGVVSEVMTEVGGMAMPGQPMLAMYEPSGLRVSVNMPQSELVNLKAGTDIKVFIPAAASMEQSVLGAHLTILPTADAVSNMAMLRLDLPLNLISVKPGMFVRVMLPMSGLKRQAQMYVPVKAVIRRSELVAVYVVNKQGRPQLRQVRLGRQLGENIEVFAGLQLGEMVALNPIAAANLK